MREIKIAASLLGADPCNLKNEVKRIEKLGVSHLHIDIMDGHFTRNFSFGPHVIKELRKHTKMIFDVHLMINKPKDYLQCFADSGADIITFHAETENGILETAAEIHALGLKAGISLNPDTPCSKIFNYLTCLDVVLIMAVSPGWGGQNYDYRITNKIKLLKEEIYRLNRTVDIEVDGGIKLENISIPAEAGANVIVAGSGIFNTPNLEYTVYEMITRANGVYFKTA